MKSLTGKFSSARGWALLLILFLGAGLFVAACGDEEVPAPTTPTPAPVPPPAPEPEPEPLSPRRPPFRPGSRSRPPEWTSSSGVGLPSRT